MTSEQLKMAEDISTDIRRTKKVIHLLKNVRSYECGDIDDMIIKMVCYKFKNDLLPIFENGLKDLQNKFNNL